MWVQSRVLPPCENNIFHLTWKNSQKNHEATPFPSVRYLYESPKANFGYFGKTQMQIFRICEQLEMTVFTELFITVELKLF